MSNHQDNKFFGVFVSDKYVDFKKFVRDLLGLDIPGCSFNENSFFYELDHVELYDFSGLINFLFNLKRKEGKSMHKFESIPGELNINEKRVLHAMIKNPEMSSSEIAKKIWISKPTVIKLRKKLLEEEYVYPYIIPNFKKMGFPYIARMSFKFDLGLPKDLCKEFDSHRIFMRILGKKRITDIVLFENEDQYEYGIDLIKKYYRKNGIDFDSNSDIFLIQKRHFGNSNMEFFIDEKLFGDE